MTKFLEQLRALPSAHHERLVSLFLVKLLDSDGRAVIEALDSYSNSSEPDQIETWMLNSAPDLTPLNQLYFEAFKSTDVSALLSLPVLHGLHGKNFGRKLMWYALLVVIFRLHSIHVSETTENTSSTRGFHSHSAVTVDLQFFQELPSGIMEKFSELPKSLIHSLDKSLERSLRSLPPPP